MPLRRILVPLFVAALAAALFLWRGFGEDPRHEVPSDVRECSENLRAIYAGLLEYRERTGQAPAGSGVAFFAALIAEGVWQDTPENRARLTCPGPNALPVPATTDFEDLAALGPQSSAYAGRNTAEFPLAKFPSGGAELEPLISCDNANGLAHRGCMNVLYSDGSVVLLTLEREIERGTLSADATTLPVGPGSPVADLRKLASD